MADRILKRRTVTQSLAWSVPAVSVAAVTPAYAASATCPQGMWRAASHYYPGTPYSGTLDIDVVENMSSYPRGMFEMQKHNSAEDTYWRLVVNIEDGAEPGATITIPVDPSWTLRFGTDTTITPNLRLFGAMPTGMTYDTVQVNGADQYFAQNLLTPSSVTVTDTEIVMTFNEPIPPHSGANFVFRTIATATSPNYTWTSEDGSTTIQTYDLFAEATMQFTPQSCVLS